MKDRTSPEAVEREQGKDAGVRANEMKRQSME